MTVLVSAGTEIGLPLDMQPVVWVTISVGMRQSLQTEGQGTPEVMVVVAVVGQQSVWQGTVVLLTAM